MGGTRVPIEIDGFEVGEEIGRGGFGVVYRARQLAFNRLVAIKVLHPGLSDEKLRKQFANECRAVGALRSHRNILGVYSTGTATDGRPYLAMQLLTGGSLSERIPLPAEQVRELGIRLAGALEIAHEGGVVHRDVKPSNVLFNEEDEPVLVDFGISSLVTDPSTTTSSIAVSIGYTAPEVLDGTKPAVAADIYALGATLFAATTGRTPFVTEGGFSSIAVVAARILTQPVEDLRTAGVPEWLCRIIETAMAKDPADRYRSMAELRVALEQSADDTVRLTGNHWRTTNPIPPADRKKIRSGRGRRRFGWGTIVAGAVLAALVVAAAVIFTVRGLSGSSGHAVARDRTDLNCDGQDDFLAVGAHSKTAGTLLFYPRTDQPNKSGLPSDWALPDPSYKIEDPNFGVTSFVQLVLPGDLTGDGAPDLVGERSDGSLWLMPGNCTGRFTRAGARRIMSATDSQVQLTADGDVDGDGIPDLLGVDSEGFLYRYSGTGHGHLHAPVRVNQGWTSAIGVGDVNGDGIPDLIDRSADGTLRVADGNGSGGWHRRGAPLSLKLPTDEFGYVIGGVDVTGDGQPDLIATDQGANLVSFAAAASGYRVRCVRAGGAWHPPDLVDIAGAVPVPKVPQPDYTAPPKQPVPPVPACATATN
jgi:serine/threonine protein kinase